MRAVLQHGIGDVRVAEVPPPSPGPGEVLLRIHAVTICASDIHLYAEGNVGGEGWQRPFVPGHEAAGVVADSNGSGLAVGTPVVFDPAIPCRACDRCARGDFHLCRDILFCDMPPTDGAMRDFLAWPAVQCFPIPEPLDLTRAPLLEPLCVGAHATLLARNLEGATVAIFGCGAVGLCTLQMARVRGAKTIFAVDPIPERRAVALALGADDTLPGGEEAVAALTAFTGDAGVDVAFEAAGPPEAMQQCLDVVRPAGEVVVIGIPAEEIYPIRPAQVRRNELTLHFCRRQNENYPEVISLVREGKVQLAPMLTHRFPVAQAAEAFRFAQARTDGAIRVAVTFE